MGRRYGEKVIWYVVKEFTSKALPLMICGAMTNPGLCGIDFKKGHAVSVFR
jgi:hypothetical protein